MQNGIKIDWILNLNPLKKANRLEYKEYWVFLNLKAGFEKNKCTNCVNKKQKHRKS